MGMLTLENFKPSQLIRKVGSKKSCVSRSMGPSAIYGGLIALTKKGLEEKARGAMQT